METLRLLRGGTRWPHDRRRRRLDCGSVRAKTREAGPTTVEEPKRAFRGRQGPRRRNLGGGTNRTRQRRDKTGAGPRVWAGVGDYSDARLHRGADQLRSVPCHSSASTAQQSLRSGGLVDHQTTVALIYLVYLSCSQATRPSCRTKLQHRPDDTDVELDVEQDRIIFVMPTRAVMSRDRKEEEKATSMQIPVRDRFHDGALAGHSFSAEVRCFKKSKGESTPTTPIITPTTHPSSTVRPTKRRQSRRNLGPAGLGEIQLHPPNKTILIS